MGKLDAVGFVIGGTALIVFHSAFTAACSATRRLLRKEGCSSENGGSLIDTRLPSE